MPTMPTRTEMRIRAVLLVLALLFPAVARAELAPGPQPLPNQTTILGSDGTVRPVPDPTTLTIDALRREIGALRELLESDTRGKFDVIKERLDGMAKAVELLQTATDRQPAFVRGEVSQLALIVDEKLKAVEERFSSVQTQFRERDTRAEQQKIDSGTAINAALQAQEKSFVSENKNTAETIAKSEASVTKITDNIFRLIEQQTKATDEKVGDLKDRLTSIESRSGGIGDMVGWLFGGISLLLAIGMAAITFSRRPETTILAGARR